MTINVYHLTGIWGQLNSFIRWFWLKVSGEVKDKMSNRGLEALLKQ
jgi:hypothetical protein